MSNPAKIHKILAVSETGESGVYMVNADLTDMSGVRDLYDYISREDDLFGLGPAIRAAVGKWIAAGNPVAPYAPPSPEELRAALPVLTRYQLRLGLLSAGITKAQVEAEIEALPEGVEKETARIEWEDATVYQRLHPLIATIGNALELTPEQIDEMWAAAAAL